MRSRVLLASGPVRVVAALAVLALSCVLAGCTPHIGDHCNLNTDCSLQGTRVCDNSQPNGYCTQFNCGPNTCPDNAACVAIYSAVPGCPYDGYQTPARTARSMCLANCAQNSDCRTGEGYTCVDPTQAPLSGVVIDDNQNKRVCVVVADYSAVGLEAGADAAAVCSPTGPMVPPIDAGVPDAPGGG